MYKACIFDLDGTLTDTLESMTRSVNLTLEEMGLPVITLDQCREFVGSGARKLMERTLKTCGDEELVRIEEAMEIYGRVFAENCTYHVKPYDGIEEMLKELKEKGIYLAVLSNKPDGQARNVIHTFFGDELFEYVQGQKEEIPRKPDPAAVFAIMEKAGVSREECVYIGDSDVDMHTGKNAGVKTVGVSWGFRSKEVLQETGADVIIDHPKELTVIVNNTKSEEEKMNGFSEECIEVFLREQSQLFDEPVAETPEEAEAFLEDCMAVVLDSLEEVKEYLEESGADVDGMTMQEIEDASEVFSLPGGQYLVVEG